MLYLLWFLTGSSIGQLICNWRQGEQIAALEHRAEVLEQKK